MYEKLFLTSLTNSELKEIITDAVRDAIIVSKPEEKTTENPPGTELITETELSKRINISKTTLWKWRNKGKIPFQRAGEKRILYDWNEVKDSFDKPNQKERLECLK